MQHIRRMDILFICMRDGNRYTINFQINPKCYGEHELCSMTSPGNVSECMAFPKGNGSDGMAFLKGNGGDSMAFPNGFFGENA